MKWKILFFCLLFSSVCALSQAQTISGKVLDESGNLPVPGVSVKVKNTSLTALTDNNGVFSIKATKGQVLVFSFIGYQSTEQIIAEATNYTIRLKSSATQLDNVVVVGYGTQAKKDLTGSVSVVTSKDIGQQPVTNVANALSGRVTGVQIVQGSSQPGSDAPVIQIRGVGTIRSSIGDQNNDSGPLVLVDGVQSTMNDVNPNDVESFSVLKDAASASIYGARAANGVILITTKRGKSGKPTINLNMYQAFQSATYTPEMLGIYDFAVLKNEAQRNSGLAPLYSDALLETFKNSSDPRFPARDYSFFDDGYRKGAPLTNLYLSVNGGSENIKYLFSTGYQDQEGIVILTGSQRLNFRSNIDATISKHVRAGLNVAGSYMSSYEPYYQNLGVTQFIRDMIRQVPFTNEISADGYPSAGNAALTAAQGRSSTNPLSVARYGGVNTTKIYRATPNVYLEVEPIKDLIFKGNASAYFENQKEDRFTNKYTVSDGVTPTSPGLGSLSNQDITRITKQIEFTGNYKKQIGRSFFSGLIGFTNQSFRSDSFSASNQGYNSPALTELDAGTLTPSVGGTAAEWALSSVFGRINYSFDDKYLVEFNLRYDGSSRFGENNRFGTFPSISVGWNIAKENFLKESKSINELKLRVSYGQLGNQNIGNYSSISTYSLARPYVFGNALVQGAAAAQLGNPDVKWETSTTKDIGIDATFFQRLTVTADYYSRVSTDLLVNPPISATLGNLTAPVQNVGSVRNQGYELLVAYNGKIGSDLNFNVSANWSHNDNKVLKLNSQFISANKVITAEGLPISSFYGNRIIGIFQTDAQAQDRATYGLQPGGISTRAGDYIYEDTNKDGVVNSSDAVVIGNPNIRNNYGFSFGLSYKGFDFKTLFQGVLGREVENGVYGTDGLRAVNNAFKSYLGRWTPDNPTATLPRVATGYNYNTSLFVGPIISSAVLDGSYLRMRSIEIGYSLPNDLLSKLKISRARFYVAGENLLTFTNFVDGFDPEDAVSFNNTNDSYPQAKTFSFGLNVSF
ncbi:SusC/RagA family TonB-linked outer membrane protein [Pedobacter sp. MW01-1-1]|uniref:SusC/RagA family TonB-linked outer membrane protein n=1 Tax=Pedobacter sp. MW01-1-1 TaxID=3383027 RepID=UPI003FF0D3D5